MVAIKILSIAVIFGFLVSSIESAENAKENTSKCSPPSEKNELLSNEKTENFIITFKKSSDTKEIDNHFDEMQNCFNRRFHRFNQNDRNTPSKISTFSSDKNSITDFSVNGHRGYYGKFTKSFVDENLSKVPGIQIEKDGPIKISRAIPRNFINFNKRTVVKNPLKNLDRIDQENRPLDKKFSFPNSAGKGVNIYVIDTGVRVTHLEFGTRAKSGAVFCTGCNDQDEDGHGTQVASIAAGNTYGVARKANIISVRVLDANGNGKKSDLLNAMAFVLDDHIKKKKISVVNMSINGGLSPAINSAVEDLTDAGIHVVVAAGNGNGADACKSSPSSAPTAITVGATEEDSEQVASYSNVGKCLTIHAPGTNIKGAGKDSDDDTLVLTGTSQASPHVVGTIALLAAEYNETPEDMRNTLIDLSTVGVLTGLQSGSPDRFLRTPAP